MYVILNFINIDYIIARNNIDRYLLDPENNNIDIRYITNNTGTDAINEKIKLLNQNGEGLSNNRKDYMNTIKERIRYNIKQYKDEYENRKFKWQEWNLSKYRTHKLLKKY